MKNLKKVLALVLAVVMIMGTVAVASAKDYADIKADSDYAEAIDVLSNLNILDGFKNGETSTTRLPTARSRVRMLSPACTATHRTRSLTATTPGRCPSSTTAASLVWLTA